MGPPEKKAPVWLYLRVFVRPLRASGASQPSHRMKSIMSKALLLFLIVFAIAACFLTGCQSKPSTQAENAASSNDPIQKKLRELSGDAAKNCGLLKSQLPSELQAASKCATEAAQAKTAFYVEYQMPGMNIALAGNAQGKLYSLQSQEGGAGLVSGDCPAEVRVAPSGRVTCYAPGTFPMSAGAGSHTNMSSPTMSIPPMMGSGTAKPHGAAGAMPPGHPAVQTDQKTKPPAP